MTQYHCTYEELRMIKALEPAFVLNASREGLFEYKCNQVQNLRVRRSRKYLTVLLSGGYRLPSIQTPTKNAVTESVDVASLSRLISIFKSAWVVHLVESNIMQLELQTFGDHPHMTYPLLGGGGKDNHS